MKKVFYLSLFVCACLSCKSTPISTEVVYDVPTYTESDWININNYQCQQSQWMQVPDDMLASDLIAILVDAYNLNVVWHSVKSDMECFWLWKNFTDSAIMAMDMNVIMDNESREAATSFCQKSALSQHDQRIDANETMYTFLYMITNKYHVQNFIQVDTLSEDVYNSATDKSNWVSGWEDLSKERGRGNSRYQAFLLHAIDTATSFNARCVYTIEYAHSSESGPGFNEAIPYLVNCLIAGTYSPLLGELWRTWRAMQSVSMGASRDSDIPNAEYNYLRMITCYTMLCHINDHPDDWLAINNFLITSYHDNICRYGSYMFGNQAVLEQMECFPEWYDTIMNED